MGFAKGQHVQASRCSTIVITQTHTIFLRDRQILVVVVMSTAIGRHNKLDILETV